ncbi:transporter substrate-binding domain-containing protein [Pseudoalteromonas tunicata]|uniref:Solute-binding protein family 3/N-terminal domain-containing protein n=1 Tax=Pseudoalteromonas tunicata D2 TaxID=87626 RepID=A4C7P6_9GAMM|nr:transporter substrate-binding domain-containing protein [Pseudoalteromonas tunicata]ATC95971.1 hypothetical protein PTUN_a3686 [Pseudoalteromonas tunicata]AXT31507.1 hypothetical protein D1819_12180 [Pseudoalteromonas tunicata]EAR30000.1 hypothetical protein PTD2_14309 [Pseudoalteromonas tunicata D2]
MSKKLYFIACFFISFQINAQLINWIIIDFAPYYINTDELEVQGRDRGVIELLHQQLPGYSFSYSQLPGSRLLHELANPQHNFCFLSLYKTPERLKLFHFSNHPSTIGLAPTIMMKKSTALKLKLQSNNPISLAELSSNHNLVLAASSNRSFGKSLDAIIKSIPAEQKIYRAGNDVLNSLMTMLHKNRVDLLLGYPDEQLYLAKKLGFIDEIEIFTIKEAPSYSVGYIGCSNNSLGKDNIAQLDQALLSIYSLPQYYQVLSRWLPEQFHSDLKIMLQQEVGQYGAKVAP